MSESGYDTASFPEPRGILGALGGIEQRWKYGPQLYRYVTRPLWYLRWRILNRRHRNAMPEKFWELADYNAERGRGIAHTPEWDERMAALQAEFDQWRRSPDG